MDEIAKSVLAAAVSFVVSWCLKWVLPEPRSTAPGATVGASPFPWRGWLIALTLGGFLAGTLTGAVGIAFGGSLGGAGFYVTGTVFGAVIGIAQWVSLRRVIRVGASFVLASSVAWGVALGAAGLFGFWLVGLAVGALQWLALRRHVRGAGWWAPANVVAWIVGGLAGVAAASAFGWVLGCAAVAMTGGAVLVLPLKWMCERTTLSEPSVVDPVTPSLR